MKKKNETFIIIFLIVFLLYNVFFWVIPFEKHASSWIVYGFSLISFIVSGLISYCAFRNKDMPKSKLYGFPVFRIGYIYLGLQILFCLAVYLLSIPFTIPAWIVIVISVLLLALALIGAMMADNARKKIEKIDEETFQSISTMNMLILAMENILDKTEGTVLADKAKHLEESFRYSDPISSEELTQIESQIQAELECLDGLVEEEKWESAEKQIVKVERKLTERNRWCKGLKK